jgi:hypothetical protein
MKHYPITEDQQHTLNQDLASTGENLERTTILLRACYGEKDKRVIRAEEARGAVQRLIWALERESETAIVGLRTSRQAPGHGNARHSPAAF